MLHDNAMSTLIFIVLLGLAFAFLATQNTAIAAFNFLGYSWSLPVYTIAFGALLVGFFISWIVSSINTLGAWSNLRGKDSKIRQSQQTLGQLQNRIRELELENAKLKGHDEIPQDEAVVEKPRQENKLQNFLNRFRRDPAY